MQSFNVVIVIISFFYVAIESTVYYSEHQVIPGTESDTINVGYSSIFLCSLKCNQHNCYQMVFDEAGKPISFLGLLNESIAPRFFKR